MTALTRHQAALTSGIHFAFHHPESEQFSPPDTAVQEEGQHGQIAPAGGLLG
ncbi:MAG TPA: hypothetical protein VH186_13615 [Chloroflexia bacterium]|nr:hypothetical protein [Chloroflexia bacterium]